MISSEAEEEERQDEKKSHMNKKDFFFRHLMRLLRIPLDMKTRYIFTFTNDNR